MIAYELRDEVAVIRMDDGKANVFSFASIDALHHAFDRAEKEARAIAWIGRAERFSGGFDLAVMRSGDLAQAAQLVTAGGKLALRMYESPLPIVIGCTGHALAMGAVVLLAADLRIGALGDWKIGLNEVAIGMTLPTFATTLAHDRLSVRHRQRAQVLAEVYDGAGAVDAGFLDRAVPPAEVAGVAIAEAAKLAALPRGAHHGTKLRVRGAALEALRRSFEEDLAATVAS